MQVMILFFSQTGGRFKWVDNWMLSYTKWGTDEPKLNYGCVYMDVDRTWKTAECTNTYYSLCKRSPGQTISSLALYTVHNQTLRIINHALSCLFFRHSTHWAPSTPWQLSRTRLAKNLDTLQGPLLFLPQLSGGQLGPCHSGMYKNRYVVKNFHQSITVHIQCIKSWQYAIVAVFIRCFSGEYWGPSRGSVHTWEPGASTGRCQILLDRPLQKSRRWTWLTEFKFSLSVFQFLFPTYKEVERCSRYILHSYTTMKHTKKTLKQQPQCWLSKFFIISIKTVQGLC